MRRFLKSHMVDNKSLSYQAYPITPIMSNEETVQGIKAQPQYTSGKAESVQGSRVPSAVIPTPPPTPSSSPQNRDK